MYHPGFVSESLSKPPNDLIGSVQRSLTILEFISKNNHGVNIKQISHELRLNLGTCYHLLNTLIACGYVVKNPENSLFVLSGKIGYSKLGAVPPSRLVELLVPYVQSIRDLSNETAYASIWDKDEIYIASKSESPLSVRVQTLNLGFFEANHATALGKAIMAWWNNQTLEEYLAVHPLTAYTEKTISNFSELKNELESVRKNGYSQDIEEYMTDVFCLGAPIFDAKGVVAASIAIALPGSRFKRNGSDYSAVILNTAAAATNMMRVLDFVTPYQSKVI
jgi:DNA-binding IclR family transcriptional regulator